MRKKLTLFFFCLFICSSPYAGEETCKEPSKTMSLFPPLGYEVAGTGRLYFHTAPDNKCVKKDVFIIPGDKIMAREQ